LISKSRKRKEKHIAQGKSVEASKITVRIERAFVDSKGKGLMSNRLSQIAIYAMRAKGVF
jgi:hypothetical protein